LASLKQTAWKDRNLLLALAHHFIAHFVLFGFFELFPSYCVTVLDIQNELLLSVIFNVGIFSVYLF